ncbi:hypothetical protein LTR84_009722 [Exophiala bonariae]|uniref:Xylanolytic transcriptional activator regulatory domain-containing protein n=1 Tax=Exophiala bonariae TaxID=1690606 RepID=A0AAV9NK82_9EURO|nr:hypothetical protein LTR84_009722 [Exophiala bonariae]
MKSALNTHEEEARDVSGSASTSLDFSWDLELSTQYLLPDSVFDLDLSPQDDYGSIEHARVSSFPRFSSHLPDINENEAELDCIDDQSEDAMYNVQPVPWSINSNQYDDFCLRLKAEIKGNSLERSLPSRNVLSRNLESFFRCSQEQLPFIHQTSFSIVHRSVGLTLAVVTLGSLFRFEHSQAMELYKIAKAVLREWTNREHLELSAELLSESEDLLHDSPDELERIQTYILLTNFASWIGPSSLPEAILMGHQLSILVMQSRTCDSDEMPDNIDWVAWVTTEERRRTIFAAYALLNLHRIAYGNPSKLCNQDIGVCVPGTAAAWKAKSHTQWLAAPRPVECLFQDLLSALLEGTTLSQATYLSAFANYVLIHGILQQMDMECSSSTKMLSPNKMEIFERALRAWQSSWELTSESTLDPLSSKGPLALNATALFRIAYMRLLPDFHSREGFFSDMTLSHGPQL